MKQDACVTYGVGMGIAHPPKEKLSSFHLSFLIASFAAVPQNLDGLRHRRMSTNCSFLIPVKSQQGIPIRYRAVFGLKTPEKRRFRRVVKVPAIFLGYFCENRAKNTQKSIEKNSFICYNYYMWGNIPFSTKFIRF